jgi:hypothetical protein
VDRLLLFALGRGLGFVAAIAVGPSQIEMAQRLGLESSFTTEAKALFIAGCACGLASYLGGLTAVLYRLKRFILAGGLGRIHYWLGLALFALSFVFAYGALRYLRTGS